MLFSLMNSLATFQIMMNIFNELTDDAVVIIYMDDILM